MSKPTLITLVYIGRRYINSTKVMRAFIELNDMNAAHHYDLKSFPYAVGSVVTFEVGHKEGSIMPSTAKLVHNYDDDEQIAAWRLEDRTVEQDRAARAFGEKRGRQLDEHLDAIHDIIEKLAPLDRSRARYYIVSKLMRGRG